MQVRTERSISCFGVLTEDIRPRLRKRKRAINSLPPTHQDASRSDSPIIDNPCEAIQCSPAPVPRQSSSPAQNQGFESQLDATVTQQDFSPAFQEPGPPRSGDNRSSTHHTPIEETSETTPTSLVHDGRGIYFEAMRGRNLDSTKAYPQTSGMSPSNMVALQASQAFDLPSRAVKSCYIDNFFKYCYPWVPIVERSWLRELPRQQPSLLLMQAVLLAGSRVTRPHNIEASGELYARAKALFFSNHEQNPVLLIITCLLLQWWNPAGPERICLDNSQFWLRNGVGIAMGIGLHKENHNSREDAMFRRRLWWTLIARDCQISAAHGRPRAIQMEESGVPPLTLRDFPPATRNQHASSVSYVTICRIFGDIGESVRRNQMTPTRVTQLQNDLYHWVRELPPELRIFHSQAEFGLNAYNFEARQLHIIYFVNLILLFRKSPSASAGSLLAASFIAAIFDEFMVRDEIGHLGPAIHKFFLLTAGITLLPACRHPTLQTQATEDYALIKNSLKQFSQRYASALATLHTLETLETTEVRGSEAYEHPQPLEPEIASLFREFGPGLCRQWELLMGQEDSRDESLVNEDAPRRRTISSQDSSITGALVPQSQGPVSTLAGDLFDMDTTIGSDGLDTFWPLSWPELPDPSSWILKDTPFDVGGDLGAP
ncbi:hypothetical protein FDECE_1199 [Fusarium decemcellulare]|nr:hypothetical protein FDECE_1199 [Fusarium decemcellulare]